MTHVTFALISAGTANALCQHRSQYPIAEARLPRLWNRMVRYRFEAHDNAHVASSYVFAGAVDKFHRLLPRWRRSQSDSTGGHSPSISCSHSAISLMISGGRSSRRIPERFLKTYGRTEDRFRSLAFASESVGRRLDRRIGMRDWSAERDVQSMAVV